METVLWRSSGERTPIYIKIESFINIILMYKRQKSPYGYQPNSPLTIHYITTGAILPEKDFPEKKISKKKKLRKKRK